VQRGRVEHFDVIIVGAGLAGLVAAAEIADAGRRVIIVAGLPLGTPGATNMIRIAFVGADGGVGD